MMLLQEKPYKLTSYTCCIYQLYMMTFPGVNENKLVASHNCHVTIRKYQAQY